MPAEQATEAWQALAALRERCPDARWLPPDKLHLTLVFLGQTDSARVPEIAEALASVAGRHVTYRAATGEAGGRVHDRRNGVAWLRLADGGHETAALALAIDDALGSRTYDARRAPHPHLTVARGVDEPTLALLQAEAARLRLAWTVERVVLFRSHTDPRGSRYEELASFDLGH